MDDYTPCLHIRHNSFVVIPARLASTRLPRKLLLSDTGKPLIQHTYEGVSRATRPSGVCVAADHPEIAKAVQGFGGRVVMTDPQAASGTDRVAEVARKMVNIDIFVNVQGDEPEIDGTIIDQIIDMLERNHSIVVATLATPIRNREQFENPACVKVVCNYRGEALYFSRAPIPYPREWDESLLVHKPHCFLQHVGVYAYRRDFLLQLAELQPSPLEQIEQLEQLRVLFAGKPILVSIIDTPSIGIDTWDDYRIFVNRVKG